MSKSCFPIGPCNCWGSWRIKFGWTGNTNQWLVDYIIPYYNPPLGLGHRNWVGSKWRGDRHALKFFFRWCANQPHLSSQRITSQKGEWPEQPSTTKHNYITSPPPPPFLIRVRDQQSVWSRSFKYSSHLSLCWFSSQFIHLKSISIEDQFSEMAEKIPTAAETEQVHHKFTELISRNSLISY